LIQFFATKESQTNPPNWYRSPSREAQGRKVTVAEVLKLKGDAVKGKQLAPRCVMCHQIDGQGAEHGPALKGF
jgi:cytochrome c2